MRQACYEYCINEAAMEKQIHIASKLGHGKISQPTMQRLPPPSSTSIATTIAEEHPSPLIITPTSIAGLTTFYLLHSIQKPISSPMQSSCS